MSVRVTVGQLQKRLAELLDRTVESGEECIIQRDGEDYAVLVSAREWERRTQEVGRANRAATTPQAQKRHPDIGRELDALGPEYRLSPEKQARVEELLSRKERLTHPERAELDALLHECDAIMLRRAEALDRFP